MTRRVSPRRQRWLQAELFSLDWHHPSMAGESRRAGRILEIVHLRIYRSLESCKFLFGEHQEEGFKEHDGFAQAGVQIIVRSVHRLPVREGFGRSAGAKILGGLAKVLAQVDDHLFERADFVQKLRTLGKEHAA